jgi:hypothetical protein
MKLRVAARNATSLLNTGAMPDGSLDPKFVDTMMAVQARVSTEDKAGW